MQHRTVVVAFGGNALVREGEHGTDREQARNAEAACRVLADLVRRGRRLLIVHGNGPQVGSLLIQMEEAALKVPPSGIDVAVAMTQGSMGYLLERALRNQLERRRSKAEVVTLVTQVSVAEDAEALRPTKPIGPFFSRYRAKALERESGWSMVEDSGRGWRKVVASPRPVAVANGSVIRELLGAGHVVIAGGGGGIPVRKGARGKWIGVEAVIDKDWTASLLAVAVGASLLVNLTGVGEVSVDFGTDREKPLHAVSASEVERYLQAGQFAEGSMGPKIEGVLAFLRGGGREAIVTDAATLRAALAGRAGTRIYRDKFG